MWKSENFVRNATIMVILCMLISFVAGWIICKDYTALTNQRKSIEQTSNIVLTVVDKRITKDFILGINNLHYLDLSNDETILVSKEDYQKFEINQSYNFEMIEQVFTTHKIRPYDNLPS